MADIKIKDQTIDNLLNQTIDEYGERNIPNGTYGPTSNQTYSVVVPNVQVVDNKLNSIGQATITMPVTHCSYCSYCSYCNAQCKQCANCTTIQCNTVQCYNDSDCNCRCTCDCDGCKD